jgi:protein-L-isoaspartate(D-aspartate) O-methyltransferase
MTNYDLARLNMVESQIRTNKVSDPALLDALETLPRERFLPPHLRGIAYVDVDVHLGEGRYLIEPRVLARLLQEAAVEPGDIVLDVGAGTGYSSAVLSRLAASVVAIESVERLAAMARENLKDLGIDTVTVIESDLAGGHEAQAPYNTILINGAVAQVPPRLTEQLADGGRLVAVVKQGDGLGKAMLYWRHGETVSARGLFDAATPMLPEFLATKGFVF